MLDLLRSGDIELMLDSSVQNPVAFLVVLRFVLILVRIDVEDSRPSLHTKSRGTTTPKSPQRRFPPQPRSILLQL